MRPRLTRPCFSRTAETEAYAFGRALRTRLSLGRPLGKTQASTVISDELWPDHHGLGNGAASQSLLASAVSRYFRGSAARFSPSFARGNFPVGDVYTGAKNHETTHPGPSIRHFAEKKETH